MAHTKDTSTQAGSTQSTAENQQVPVERQSQRRGLSRREDSLPSLWTESPFALMRRFSEEMDRLFGSGLSADFGWGRNWPVSRFERRAGFPQVNWIPPTEIFERDGQLIVRADLPGLNKDDMNVEVTDDMLTITGERREERDETREGYRHSERHYGRFSRSIPLPEGINAEEVQATFQNGVLEVTMPVPGESGAASGSKSKRGLAAPRSHRASRARQLRSLRRLHSAGVA